MMELDLTAAPKMVRAQLEELKTTSRVEEPGWLWGTNVVERTKTVSWPDVPVDHPDVLAGKYGRRWYQYSRHVLRLVQANGYRGALRVVCYVINGKTFTAGAEQLTIAINPDLVAKYGGKPVAVMTYCNRGTGKETYDSDERSLKVYFASDEQANQYLIASGRGMPQKLRYRGETYERQDDGSYQSSGGLILAALVMLWLLTPSDEGRAQLLEQHPELKELTEPVEQPEGEAAENATEDDQQDDTADDADFDDSGDDGDRDDGDFDGGDSGD
ncbi:MAG: hypothetical protein JO019_02330 [Candidatus Kaiserbacteria bacterium]|nr:hypothetical protein [Candidatus Kaiserbacteria bacterium]